MSGWLVWLVVAALIVAVAQIVLRGRLGAAITKRVDRFLKQ